MDNLATLANLAEVKGELRVPNTIMDRLLPTLEPAAALVYLRLLPAVARIQKGYLPRRSAKARKCHKYQPENCAARH